MRIMQCEKYNHFQGWQENPIITSVAQIPIGQFFISSDPIGQI